MAGKSIVDRSIHFLIPALSAGIASTGWFDEWCERFSFRWTLAHSQPTRNIRSTTTAVRRQAMMIRISSFITNNWSLVSRRNWRMPKRAEFFRFPGYYPSDSTYLGDYSWTSLPVCHTDSFTSIEPSNEFLWKQVSLKKKSKVRHSRKRTKFSSEDLEILNLFFDKNPMPSRADISILAEKLAYPRYIVQVRRIDLHGTTRCSLYARYGSITNVNRWNARIPRHHHLNWTVTQVVWWNEHTTLSFSLFFSLNLSNFSLLVRFCIQYSVCFSSLNHTKNR